MRTILYISFILISVFCYSCSKNDKESLKPNNSTKKIVEVKITFGANYAQYDANIGLQVASVDADLKEDFNFLGINSTQSIFHNASIIHQADLSPIPSSTISIKTSVPVSTFSIATVATNITNSANPLTANFEFYVDGKKTTSKSLTFLPNSIAAKSLILDTTKPKELIEN